VDNTNIRLPFKWISSFYRNNDDTFDLLKETYEGIIKCLSEEKLNFAIMLFYSAKFVVVFTEEEIKLDSLILKLSTGINFNKQVEYNLNEELKRLFTDKEFLETLKTKNIIR
jgi:uncharacterized protein YdeI (YjbR/CyaY-like superfamily)